MQDLGTNFILLQCGVTIMDPCILWSHLSPIFSPDSVLQASKPQECIFGAPFNNKWGLLSRLKAASRQKLQTGDHSESWPAQQPHCWFELVGWFFPPSNEDASFTELHYF